MSKVFTILAAVLFLIAATAHAYRLYVGGFAITVASHNIPLWVSWPAGGIALLFAIMLLVESRR